MHFGKQKASGIGHRALGKTRSGDGALLLNSGLVTAGRPRHGGVTAGAVARFFAVPVAVGVFTVLLCSFAPEAAKWYERDVIGARVSGDRGSDATRQQDRHAARDDARRAFTPVIFRTGDDAVMNAPSPVARDGLSDRTPPEAREHKKQH